MVPKNILDELAVKYGTDKFGKHHYTQVYYDLFKSINHKVKKVLEIGPAEGAGLFMFRDFFPNAIIYGAEIDQERVNKLQGLDRIEVFQCDQSKSNDLINLMNQTDADIDLVVDDGSHKPDDQLFTAIEIIPCLNQGATYIIEDVDNESAEALFDLLKKRFPYHDCQMLSVGSRHDDRLIIITKL